MILESSGSGMPAFQTNAHVNDGVLVRVGIPHSGGKLAFHAFNEEYAGMVSASAFWNPKTGRFRIPEATDLTEIDFALDSAGFTATKLFQSKGRQKGIAGIYPWTMEQYVELASFSGAAWRWPAIRTRSTIESAQRLHYWSTCCGSCTSGRTSLPKR